MLGITLPISGVDLFGFYTALMTEIGPWVASMLGIQVVLDVVFLVMQWFRGQVR